MSLRTIPKTSENPGVYRIKNPEEIETLTEQTENIANQTLALNQSPKTNIPPQETIKIEYDDSLQSPSIFNIVTSIFTAIFHIKHAVNNSHSRTTSSIRSLEALLFFSQAATQAIHYAYPLGSKVLYWTGMGAAAAVALEAGLTIQEIFQQTSFEKTFLSDIKKLIKLAHIQNQDTQKITKKVQKYISSVKSKRTLYQELLSSKEQARFQEFVETLSQLDVSNAAGKEALQTLLSQGLFFALKLLQKKYLDFSPPEQDHLNQLDSLIQHETKIKILQRKINELAKKVGKPFSQKLAQKLPNIITQLTPENFITAAPHIQLKTLQKAEKLFHNILKQSYKQKIIHIVSLFISAALMTTFFVLGGWSFSGIAGLALLLVILAGIGIRSLLIAGWFNNPKKGFSWNIAYNSYMDYIRNFSHQARKRPTTPLTSSIELS
ncbi:MAG: hypothetical protein JW769_04085 [Parachlamydiales bacterium]|nr:hypothetical protein [Parachlamydiales bacterium]